MSGEGASPGAGGGRLAGGPVDPVVALEQRLAMPVVARGMALAALTHKSYVNEHKDDPGLQDNERLEFLGDAVIDLAVSHRLMEQFPAAREGELSKMRAAVVDEQGLCEMARALDLGPLLRLGRGEELTGGREKPSLLADAMEAVIASLFLGAGLPPVFALIDRFLGEACARAAAGTLDRDFKTQLQELAQSRMRASPRYRVVAEHGPDHSKTFEVEVDLRGEVLGRGVGRSKKDAEQAAAKLAIEALGRRFAEAAPPPAEPFPLPAASLAPPPAPAPSPAPSVAAPAEAPRVEAPVAADPAPSAAAQEAPAGEPEQAAAPRPKRTRKPAARTKPARAHPAKARSKAAPAGRRRKR
ncbi:MAG: ribonuclease III [Anaeromyxobacter sp.]